MKFCEYICKRLEEIGCKYVFGVPGSYIMPIWQSVNNNAKLILSRHESGGAYMADGLSKFSGKLGVVLTTIGPGVTNVITGIAGAYQDSTPLLVITGQTTCSKIGSGIFQESSIGNRGVVPTELMSCISKISFEITSKDNAISLFEKALTIALSNRTGPVHLSIPLDIQDGDIRQNSKCVFYNPKTKINNNFFNKEIFSKINSYKRPLILVGWGCFLSQCSDKILELSYKISAPIISTIKGLSAVSFYWNTFLGHVGPAANKEVLEFISEYSPDSLIVLGASMSSYYMEGLINAVSHDIVCVQVDVSSEQLGYNYKVNYAVNSDVSTFLNGLLDYLKNINNAHNKEVLEKIATWKFHILCDEYVDKYNNVGVMSKTIHKLNELLPENATVIPDAGNHWLDVLSLYRTKNPFGFCTNSGLGTMGYAIGASIGIKLARPERRVICVSGDGSMLMSGCEISIIPKLNIDNVYIVYNNESLGRVKVWQNANADGKIVASDIGKVNFAKWVQAQGIKSYQTHDIYTFSEAVKKALKSYKASFIEVVVDKNETPFCFLN
jgi:acetolactate synthase-1/2/3 large subunit